jgi:hypothetical protein
MKSFWKAFDIVYPLVAVLALVAANVVRCK